MVRLLEQLYCESCDTYSKSLEAHKTKYYREKIEQADKTKLLKIVRGLFHKTKDELPSHTTFEVLADDFNKLFRNKILLIRNNLHRNKGTLLATTVSDDSSNIPATFDSFYLPEGETIRKVIGMLRPKTCTLDPIPTHLIKDNLPILVPTISNIVRTSLPKGIFPQSLKISHIRPKVKKTDLKQRTFHYLQANCKHRFHEQSN